MMPDRVEFESKRRWMRRTTVATSCGLVCSISIALWLTLPASSEASTTTTAPAGSSLALESFDFSNPTSGFGVFTDESPGGQTCADYVGKSTDGGAVFRSLVKAMTWDCANSNFGSFLTTDGMGDAFLYGPQLFISHDNTQTWTRSPPFGSVLDVKAIGRSIWIVTSTCARAREVSDSPCPVRLRESSDGGRTWQSSLPNPSGASGGISYGAHGQSYLVRLSRSSAYLMTAPSVILSGRPSTVPLWFTSNGGRSWSNRQVPCHIGALSAVLSAAPNETLMAVCASGPNTGSQIKSVLESIDGGRTWILKTDSNIDVGYLGAIDLLNRQEAFLVGGRSSLSVTHDGGAVWTAVQPPLAGSDGGTSEVDFFNFDHGLVLVNDSNNNEKLTLWSTTDGGRRWSVILSRVIK